MPARFMLNAAAIAMLAAPLGGCGFDRFDGRWVANVPPAGDCCPSQVVMDVDGHKFSGSTQDCTGAAQFSGHVTAQGDATLHMQGRSSQVHFAGENFTGTVPNDRCKRSITGNRGG